MSIQAILFPVFVQVALTIALLVWMGNERRLALKRRDVKTSDIALSDAGWPPRARQIGNCFRNQFEVPVLFYVAVILAILVHSAGTLFVFLEWLFVALRLAHAAIHTTWNDVPMRGRVFGLGFVVLIVMWLVLAARVFLGIV